MEPPELPYYLEFWGKAQPREDLAQSRHPAAYHCLDVAAVAEVLLRRPCDAVDRMILKFDLPRNDLIKLFIFLIGLHDIGKFSRSFQGLVPEHWPKALGDDISFTQDSHWQLSWDLLSESGGQIQIRLMECLGLDHMAGLDPLLGAVAGHHGRPAKTNSELSPNKACDLCRDAAVSFLDDAIELFSPPKAPWLNSTVARQLSYWLAGLTVAADWLGSNQEQFAYHAPTKSLEDYWDLVAKSGANSAVEKSGLVPSTPEPNATLRSLFGVDLARPMQKKMAHLPLSDGPMFVVIEDATGSGKTEAACLLAQRMMVAGKAGGLYFALPTMATANAMFERMGNGYRNFFSSDTNPSLALAHGKRNLHDGFDAVKLAAFKNPATLTGADEEVSAQCAAWIADDRRKIFFAEVGVGTIDQALLSVLPSKFQSLRLWALADRILIVDEAHAYDAYMSKELETLLEFHAAMGGSAIVLSATLPASKRQSLARAFCKGLGYRAGYEAERNAVYPLVTVADQKRVEEINGIEGAANTVRSVRVERCGDVESVVELIVAAVEANAAVAWVRNAVDDAIEAVGLLRARGVTADLFHARYAMGDRQEIETIAVDRFGRKGAPEGRNRRVLVATQVIEQSLDLDFDLMVSDLAPIDLLIQRAGRLWRHMDIRPKGSRPVIAPKLLVLSPDPDKVEDDKWLKQLGHKGASVYRNHALLWRTAKLLFDAGCFKAPGDLRHLIEAVYGDPAELGTPDVLKEYDREGGGSEMNDATMAGFNVLNLCDGYARSGSWLEETAVKTRLGEQTRTVRLARVKGESVEPYYHCDNDLRAWALSEISVDAKWLDGAEVSQRWRSAIDAVHAQWPAWQQDILIAPVDDDGRVLIDWPQGSRRMLNYSYEFGLERVGGSG